MVNMPKTLPNAEVTAQTLMVLNLLFCVLEFKKHWRSAISLARLEKYTLSSLHFLFFKSNAYADRLFLPGRCQGHLAGRKQVDLCERQHTQGPLCHV